MPPDVRALVWLWLVLLLSAAVAVVGLLINGPLAIAVVLTRMP
jgi:hypothetical protein